MCPQPATARAPPAGVPRCPSAPSVQGGSSSTRASVWRPVVRGSTPRTTPATVRALAASHLLIVQHCLPQSQSLCPVLLSHADCHPSCRSCVGPLASDCLHCLKPEEVLMLQSSHHGVCTAGCPAHSFLDSAQTCRGECVRLVEGGLS